MRVLLDENLDRRLASVFPSEHDVETVGGKGWSGTKNGQLLTVASAEFDGFVTADRNLGNQQNIGNFDIAVFVFVAPSNRLADHLPLVPLLLAELSSAQSGTLTEIESTDDDE